MCVRVARVSPLATGSARRTGCECMVLRTPPHRLCSERRFQRELAARQERVRKVQRSRRESQALVREKAASRNAQEAARAEIAAEQRVRLICV